MTTYDQIPDNYREDFEDMVDNVILGCDFDPELKNALQYLDEKSKLTESSIYEIIYSLLGKHLMEERVKEWRDERNKFL